MPHPLVLATVVLGWGRDDDGRQNELLNSNPSLPPGRSKVEEHAGGIDLPFTQD